MGYLGTTLAEDGRIHSEFGRRIGIAKADFDTLPRVWKHSTLGRKRKLYINLPGARRKQAVLCLGHKLHERR